MQILQILCLVNGEHYYCLYKEVSDIEYTSCVDIKNSQLYVHGGTDLFYTPTIEYAEELVKTSNGGIINEIEVDDIMAFGASRFKTIHNIYNELISKYPNKHIICAYQNSISKFWETYNIESFEIEFDKLANSQKETIFIYVMEYNEPLSEDAKNYYNRLKLTYKYHLMFVEIYKNNLYTWLKHVLEDINGGKEIKPIHRQINYNIKHETERK